MLTGRRKKAMSVKSPREASRESEKEEKAFKPGKVTTPVALVDLHFVVENAISKSCVYDYFNFSTNSNFTVGVDPFETITQAQPTDMYICFCDNPLGPCDPKSFAHTISLRFGRKKDIEKGIYTKYLGEIPPNTPFCYSVTDNTELVFVVLDPENSLSAYHATRAALLTVIDRCGPSTTRKRINSQASTLTGSDSATNYRTQSKKNLKIPEAFQSQSGSSSAASIISKEPIMRSQSMRVPQKQKSKNTINHITFSVLGSSKTLSQAQFVWQMAKAYRGMITSASSVIPLSTIERRYAKCLNVPNDTEDKKQKKFAEYVKREELVRRGIVNAQEVTWLLGWLTDGSSLPMQLAAAVSLVNYIQSEKATLPIDLSRKQVLDALFMSKDKCLATILDLAGKGLVSLHRVIKQEEITKADIVGKGGTAVVYCAKFQNNDVAYKEFIEGTVTMGEFRREVALMSLLKHPCLVNIIGAGESTEAPFLVMEYVSKGDLYHLLHEGENKERIKDETIVAWAMDIACGMQYLHSLGIIHRDLKSLNILVTQDDRCKIIDYGASRVDVDSNMTGNIGTVSWMAPEMFAGGSYTEKIDVYSFGIVLYELVVREIPFSGENAFSVPVQVAKGVRPKVPKGISKRWTKLLGQCWHERPSKRPAFSKIVDTLQGFLHGAETPQWITPAIRQSSDEIFNRVPYNALELSSQ